MFCVHCGAANADDAFFCGNCGNRIRRRGREESTLHSSLPSHNRKVQPLAPRKNLRRNVVWFLAGNVMATAILGLILSLLLQARYDDLHYGNPRTFQVDAVVGHGDDPQHPSHFIAINLHQHIIVIEFMGGNPARSISYEGPYLFESGGDLTPVTLQFCDVTGDGKPDMLIHIQDQAIVFVNDGTQFRPQNSTDHISSDHCP